MGVTDGDVEDDTSFDGGETETLARDFRTGIQQIFKNLILLNLDLHDPVFMISSHHSRYPADYNCKHNTRSSDTQHVRCLCYLR